MQTIRLVGGAENSVVRSPHQSPLFIIAMVIIFLCANQRAEAQVQLAEEIIVISKGVRAQEQGRTTSHLGNAPGAGGNRFRIVPGGGEPALGERSGEIPTTRRDILSAASKPLGGPPLAGAAEPIMTPSPRLSPAQLPLYGALEVPALIEEGPPDGLTLDLAINRLVQENLELRTKFQELPKAQADILTAGLRGNPLIFASANDVPYGSYSPQRPGENGYGISIIQPVDVNHKRRVRILAAQRAKRVLDAQYQDAVRLEIDNLYTAFVDVLAARDTVHYLEASFAGLDESLKVTEKQFRGEQRSGIERDRLLVQRASALIALEEAQAIQAKATQVLALRLNIPPLEGERLAVRGRILTPSDDLPPLEELVGLAIESRPDLTAYRLGTQRAQADVSLARAEAFPDVFVLYTPFGFRNNTPTGGKDATSWSLGVMASVPLFNRNQGNVRRAELNVSQTRTELAGLERQIETEVRGVFKDYETALAAVRRLDQDVLPLARNVRDKTFSLFRAGEESTIGYLNAQREYSEVVRQYRDALIRHRRAALRLNTVIALRIIP